MSFSVLEYTKIDVGLGLHHFYQTPWPTRESGKVRQEGYVRGGKGRTRYKDRGEERDERKREGIGPLLLEDSASANIERTGQKFCSCTDTDKTTAYMFRCLSLNEVM